MKGILRTREHSESSKERGKEIQKRLVWADEVGVDLATVGGRLDEGKTVLPERIDGDGLGHLMRPVGSALGVHRGPLKESCNDHSRRKHRYGSDSTDEEGEGALKASRNRYIDEKLLHAYGKGVAAALRNGVNGELPEGKIRIRFESTPGRGRCRGEDGGSNSSYSNPASYKEALLWRGKPTHHPSVRPLKIYSTDPRPKALPRQPRIRRCFRCLASDHFVAACRDPVRCRRCLRTGHRVQQCEATSGVKANGVMFRLHQR